MIARTPAPAARPVRVSLAATHPIRVIRVIRVP